MPKTSPLEAEKGGRLNLPLTADGSAIDWDHVRGSNKEKFLGVLQSDPEIRAAYREVHGLNDGDAADNDLFAGVTEANVRAGLDILSQVNALVFRVAASRFIKHPLLKTPEGKRVPIVLDMDIVIAAFKMTEAQHAELDPRATRIAQKFSNKMPAWMRDNMDWIMLGSMYLKYTAANAQAAMINQVKRDVAKIQAAQEAAAVEERKLDSDAQPRKPVAFTQPINGHDIDDKATQPLQDVLNSDYPDLEAPIV